MSLAVGQSLLLVVSVPQERLLAFRADKVLHVPVLAQSSDDAFLDGPATSAANRYAHFVVAPQAVQLVHLVGGIARSRSHLSGIGVQLHAASRAIEVIRMIDLAAEAQRLVVNYSMALVANVLAQSTGFHASIAIVAQRSALALDESGIGQFAVALLATETARMPIGVHRLDYSPDYEFTC